MFVFCSVKRLHHGVRKVIQLREPLAAPVRNSSSVSLIAATADLFDVFWC